MHKIVLLSVMILIINPANAEKIYKSVDAEGNVTYSSQPPQDAVTVKPITPEAGPSEAEIKETQQRNEAIRQKGDEMAESSAKRQAESAPSKVEPEKTVVEEPVGENYPYYRQRPVRPRPKPERPVTLPARGK